MTETTTVRPKVIFCPRPCGRLRKVGPRGEPPTVCERCAKAKHAMGKGETMRRRRAEPGGGRAERLWRYYRLTPGGYSEILERQGGVCGICGIERCPVKPHFGVDHCHGCCPGVVSCGCCIRGLLCSPCNIRLDDGGLATFKESNPLYAASRAYLSAYDRRSAVGSVECVGDQDRGERGGQCR